jgi:hypothetical protein
VSKATGRLRVTRGQESWTYIFSALGFALTIEGNVIAMTPSIKWYHIPMYVAVSILTIWAFIRCTWLHDRLFALKIWYEKGPH